ncbi:FAD-dependent oxidoreductase [Neobacillus cucumis]|uniref:FAD-dependent oxidoreductase n=1 Tax=Neobacillus cucumis TaxID=1740721 RepID=UPI0019660BFA|nr:FAD-dependent oxidoreductase [Neobacillus cucumis]MBM7650688.1 glycine/D-amino acid oxidase-like deaminating enzyme/nitrite reductase/ring-hydroxylating ferredoxin subunit [Neobacillus cucumis]
MSSTDNTQKKFPRTYWREIELPTFQSLDQDINVDVAIVGGGITGITAAYLLTKEGLNVAILEAGGILNGTTGHTTAKLTAQHGLIYDEFIHHLGKEKARKYYESMMMAVQFVENTVKEKGIDCDFSKQEAYVYATTDEYAAKLKNEWEAYKSLDIAGALKDSIPFNIPVKAALMMSNQAQFHPLKFLKALLEEAINAGCSVYENTVADGIEDDYQEPKVVTKSGQRVTAKHVIIASHFPFYDKPGLYFAKMYADRSYAIGVKTNQEYPGGMYISADSPSRSIRYTPLDNGENLLIVGGENHKTGQGVDTLKHFEELQHFTEEVFGINEYQYRWSAQDNVTLDKIPYIGPYTSQRKNVLVATGYKKWGMSTGILAAHLLTDLIVRGSNRFEDIYSPSRFQADPDLKSVITTNADVAKHLLKGKLEMIERVPDDLQNGEGSVVLYQGKRAGAYKDDNGTLYIVDTTCTHLGCECEWNHAEKSWDCPCHGSRYSYAGDVIEGPTHKPLGLLRKGEV